jgi:hypothetical protein
MKPRYAMNSRTVLEAELLNSFPSLRSKLAAPHFRRNHRSVGQ